MRDERALSRACLPVLPLALVCVLTPAGPRPASAQGLRGYVQGQYQHYEELIPVRDSLGGVRFEHRDREYWVQTIDLLHQASLRPNLMVQSTLRFSDLNYLNLPDASRTPQGSIQLLHTWASAYAGYRPATVTSGFGPQGATVADTGSRATVTAKTQEALFLAQVFPPNLPRLDLTWTRRHRNGDLMSHAETGTTRNARLGYTRGGLTAYGQLGDQHRETEGVSTERLQRTGNAGGTLHLAPLTDVGLDLNYEFADTKGPARSSGAGDTQTQNAGVNGGWRSTAASMWTATWQVRRSHTGGPTPTNLQDQEGNASWMYSPRKPWHVTAGFGERTVRDVGGQGLQQYANAIASIDGRVRPNWNASGNLTHITNWDPFHGQYSVDGARATTRARLARGLDVDADGGVTANSDTASRDTRAVGDLNAHVLAVPLRSIMFGARARLYRAGPTLGTAAALSRSTLLELRWKPTPSTEVFGTRGVTGALPHNKPRVSTNTLSLKWAPSARLQLSGDWSRSDQLTTTSGAFGVTGRETASARLIALIARNLTLNTGGGVAERGTPRENRQLDASLTWNFGR
jgi:hypothetical protein